MYHNRLKLGRQLLKKAFPVFFLVLFGTCYSARAQYQSHTDPNWGIVVGSDYDAPVGNLSYTFKPAINYNLSAVKYSGDFSMNFTFSYHQYKPKQDTFYYQLSKTEYGRVTYGNFPVFAFYLGLNYHLTVTDQFKIYCGFNLGEYATHYVAHSVDYLVDDNEDLHEADLYIAPKLGLTYMVQDNIGIGLEGKYNLFAPTGDKDYNDRVGTLYNSYSVGIRLTYNF